MAGGAEIIDLCDSSDDERRPARAQAGRGAGGGAGAGRLDSGQDILIVEPQEIATAEKELDSDEEFAVVAETGQARTKSSQPPASVSGGSA